MTKKTFSYRLHLLFDRLSKYFLKKANYHFYRQEYNKLANYIVEWEIPIEREDEESVVETVIRYLEVIRKNKL